MTQNGDYWSQNKLYNERNILNIKNAQSPETFVLY